MRSETIDSSLTPIYVKDLKVGDYALTLDTASVVIRVQTGLVFLRTGYTWSESEMGEGVTVLLIAPGTKITIEIKGQSNEIYR
jgi:hypothetical protein